MTELAAKPARTESCSAELPFHDQTARQTVHEAFGGPNAWLRITPIRPEYLLQARSATAQSIELEFDDGLVRRLSVARLRIPVDRMRWDTVKASPTGEAMMINAVDGDLITIDSSSLRYLVDPAYAAEIDKALDEVQLTRDELRELLAQPNRPLGGQAKNKICPLIRDIARAPFSARSGQDVSRANRLAEGCHQFFWNQFGRSASSSSS